MLEQNKKEIINQLEQNTGSTTIFLEKFGENICWAFTSNEGESGVAFTKDTIQGQIVISTKSLEAILAKIKQTK